jgi:secreted PhoX family phosphatase
VSGLIGLVVGIGLVAGAAAQDATPMASPAAAPVVAPGSTTTARPYIVATDPAAVEITPILTSGEMVGDYQMAAVPDGLGAFKDGSDTVLFMNHELNPEDAENLSAARVSRLVLDGTTGAVMSGSYALDGTEGYERLCSASWAGTAEGWDTGYFLTGEESTSGPHGGMSLAIDAAGTSVTELPWLGHLAHENQVAVPGFADKTVVVTTEDDSSGSHLYIYVAASPADVIAGNGQLYVFKADNGTNTADVAKGTDLTGTFVPIDQADNTDADALEAAATSAGAFRFVRLEDVTYDRTTTTTIYFTDTGDNTDGNLATPTATPLTANGRLYSLAFDPADPTKVTSLKVLLDGDAGDDIRNPDNIDASASTIMINEDLNGYNRAEGGTPGRILAYDIASGAVTVVATIDQSDDPDSLTDPGVEAGEWETSGIINVSDLFGEGAWLVDVQAHTLEVPQFGGVDEGGQLLLIRVM